MLFQLKATPAEYKRRGSIILSYSNADRRRKRYSVMAIATSSICLTEQRTLHAGRSG